ncbi:MAG TPA: Na+/H+ antiporter [Gemmatimonadales bacterium]|jgi:CPA1 family monovalent cation:H+ antiporter|nr:Na+/H+ antiporter [Gemmatimonadales bacterium]
MAVFELVIVLLLVGAVLAAWARRLNLPYPALLALAGAGLALIPNVPSVTLDPQLALALFVAPVLLDAAFDTSPRDLKRHWRPVASLALFTVAVTVAAVAVVARWSVPALPWPAAIALGAIVAPPDAAAAITVLRQLRPPHRLLVILGGESLLNDATALLIYRLAVAAAMTGAISGWKVIPTLAFVAIGSVVLGAVLSRVTLRVTSGIEDIATAVIVQFLSTFGVWIIAERLGLSGIITMVVYAILVAREAPDLIPARVRVPSYAVWEVVVFVLNALAFILVGLQLKPILNRLNGTELVRYTLVAALVCLTVILVRILWVTGYVMVARWAQPRPTRSPDEYPSFRAAAVVAWCGMRGTVTLAAALALPDGPPGTRFPYRDLILFTAFSVVLVTLVIQGMTVRPLMRALDLHDDGTVEREVQLARAETARAALDAVDHGDGGGELIQLFRRKYQDRLRKAERASRGSPAADGDGESDFTEVQRRAQAAERRTLSDLRTQGVIGDDAFHRVEEELDWAEMHREGMARGG